MVAHRSFSGCVCLGLCNEPTDQELLDLLAARSLPCSANTENYMVAEEDDDGADRTVFSIGACPCAQDKCQLHWKKYKPWSFHGQFQCLGYLKYHLVHSGKHQLSRDMAQEIIEHAIARHSIEHVTTIDTADDRRRYREQVHQAF